LAGLLAACAGAPRGTGDLGVVVERASGSLLVVDTTARAVLSRVGGLGDLSHASVVFSRDERFAFVFGRDGGLSKIDLLEGRIVRRVVQGGNAIGGAISQDGRLVAVSNYEPGGVRVFDAATLDLVADVPAVADGRPSKVVGLVDAPGRRFVWSLYEAGDVWVGDFADPRKPLVRRFPQAGLQPYDGLITPGGRHYLAGLFGEDGMVLLDLWNLNGGVRKVLPGYGKGEQKLPVYKMPHLEGWAVGDGVAFVPAVGHHEVLAIDMTNWTVVARIPVHGQPVFVVGRPDGRHAWVNFALPHNDTIQVIDLMTRRIVRTLKPGKGVLHMEFTPKGEEVWVSLRDADKVAVYDSESFAPLAEVPAVKPSGIFFTPRAHRIGM
jgi:protein NirF